MKTAIILSLIAGLVILSGVMYQQKMNTAPALDQHFRPIDKNDIVAKIKKELNEKIKHLADRTFIELKKKIGNNEMELLEKSFFKKMVEAGKKYAQNIYSKFSQSTGAVELAEEEDELLEKSIFHKVKDIAKKGKGIYDKFGKPTGAVELTEDEEELLQKSFFKKIVDGAKKAMDIYNKFSKPTGAAELTEEELLQKSIFDKIVDGTKKAIEIYDVIKKRAFTLEMAEGEEELLEKSFFSKVKDFAKKAKGIYDQFGRPTGAVELKEEELLQIGLLIKIVQGAKKAIEIYDIIRNRDNALELTEGEGLLEKSFFKKIVDGAKKVMDIYNKFSKPTGAVEMTEEEALEKGFFSKVKGIASKVTKVYKKVVVPAIAITKSVGQIVAGNYVGGACGLYNTVNSARNKNGNKIVNGVCQKFGLSLVADGNVITPTEAEEYMWQKAENMDKTQIQNNEVSMMLDTEEMADMIEKILDKYQCDPTVDQNCAPLDQDTMLEESELEAAAMDWEEVPIEFRELAQLENIVADELEIEFSAIERNEIQ